MVSEAHDVAVTEALGYLERHARTWTRRGRAGRMRVRGEGLTVATFRHRASRAGDPQLHTHSFVANATTALGSITALDGRALYAHARTAGYLYQAVLREQLTRSVGVEWQSFLADRASGTPDRAAASGPVEHARCSIGRSV
jgi:conjugative relaxase-like TrwC/TraI family protein